MTCTNISNGLLCITSTKLVRLRTETGRYIYMDWHRYLGPIFFKDKLCLREFEDWYEYEDICEALNWWIHRGEKG